MENKQWLDINYSFETEISGPRLTSAPAHRGGIHSSFKLSRGIHINSYQTALLGLAIIKELVNTHQKKLLPSCKTQEEEEEEEEQDQNKWPRPISRRPSCLGSKLSAPSARPRKPRTTPAQQRGQRITLEEIIKCKTTSVSSSVCRHTQTIILLNSEVNPCGTVAGPGSQLLGCGSSLRT